MPRRGGLMCRSTATRGGASCDAGTLPQQGARVEPFIFQDKVKHLVLSIQILLIIFSNSGRIKTPFL
ncbi:MAG: hypothetical protein KatS3mg101_1193 [Patescibacteria group bacterium]|nr:MAG: hypothetical protein KatS3mg101_1193 [Patescibacteria group bacterium]